MYNRIINFWFSELTPKNWFENDITLDTLIRERFSLIHTQATQGELYEWRSRPEGALAEIIVLDQFSRNIYRGQAAAFASDGMALVLAQTALQNGYEKQLSPTMRAFLFLPFMHSESPVIHEMAVTLFDQPGLEENFAFELKHKAIIDRYGRYPHRNKILGRATTEAEATFLEQPDSAF